MKLYYNKKVIDLNISNFEYIESLNKIDSLKISLFDNNNSFLLWPWEDGAEIKLELNNSISSGKMFLERYSYKNNVFKFNSYSCKNTHSKSSDTWENVDFISLCKDIAKKENMSINFHGITKKDNFTYSRIDQIEKNNMAFLLERAIFENCSIKIFNNEINVISEDFLLNQETYFNFKKNDLGKPKFNYSPSEFGSCIINSFDSNLNVFKCKSVIDKKRNIFKLDLNVSSREEGERISKNILYDKNKYNTTVKFYIDNETPITSGMKITIEGYGLFNGVYIVESVSNISNKINVFARKV